MTPEQIWQTTLGQLEVTLSKANFVTWFKNTHLINLEDKKAIIGVPNTFTKIWLEKKYQKSILQILQSLTNQQIKEVVFQVSSKTSSLGGLGQIPTREAVQLEIKENKPINKFGLNPRYTFDNFVVGKGNELAHAAAKAVVDRLGTAYNPLFIYGGVGLGKTHLLQALGNEVLKKYPKKKVLYVTCETFTNEFIEAVRNGAGKKFHDTYRNVDLLLIDDIQFISGKTETQEAFFHTFNDLYQANKQIVISSDRPPKSIATLENRLVSRFESGMIADITPPDFETRTAILEAKCKEKNYSLNKEIIRFIAANVQNNVRELEGTLNKIIALHQLKNIEPTIELVKSIILNNQQTMKKNLVPKQIIQTVANFYDLKVEDLLGNSREKKFALPRQIVMYLLRTELRASFPAIGQELNGRDHTTAMHAVEKIQKYIENDPKIRDEINLIKERLYSAQ